MKGSIMAQRIPFTNHEAAVLLDGYLKTKLSDVPKRVAVRDVSAALRKMAVNNGLVIDQVYRNVSGISFQMSSMESAFAGQTVEKPATRLFCEIVFLYRNDRNQFEKLLSEAQEMIGESSSVKELNGNNQVKQQFIDWMADKVPPSKLSDLLSCYPEIERYCRGCAILSKSLFETTDYGRLRKVESAVTKHRLFELKYRKRKKLMISAIQYYISFTETLSKTTVDAPASKETITVPDVSSGEKHIDFNNIQSLAFTKPFLVSYRGKELKVSSWCDAYAKLVSLLFREYPNIIPVGESFFGNGRADLGNMDTALKMTAPKKIDEDLYLETNYSADDLVKRLRCLLDICLVDPSAVEIRYADKRNNSLTTSGEKNDRDANQASQSAKESENKTDHNLTYLPAKEIPECPTPSPPIVTENKKDTTSRIDFYNIPPLANIRPTAVSYRGQELTITSWADAYAKIISAMFRDYPNILRGRRSIIENNRVEIGNIVSANIMTAPKKIDDDLYVETAFTPEELVRRLKRLLDICLFDYSQLDICYTASGEHIEEPTSEIVLTTEKNFNLDSDSFCSYIRDELKFGYFRSKAYADAIPEIFSYMNEHGFSAEKLADGSFEDASSETALLFQNAEFIALNRSKSNVWSEAILALLKYKGVRQSKDSSTPKPVYSTTVSSVNDSMAHPPIKNRPEPIISPAQVTPTPQRSSNSNLPLFEKVMETHFTKGFRLGSTLDMKKFRRYYEELNKASLGADDNSIENTLKSIGIIYDGKVFLPKAMLSEEIKSKLFAYIKKTFESGKNSIYYAALFKEFSEDFLDHHIYDPEMLGSYLKFVNDGSFHIRKDQITKESGISSDPVEDVRNCLREHILPMGLSEIYSELSHIPQNNIYSILCSNPEFVRDGKGKYFHSDSIALSENELRLISGLIETEIKLHKFISGNELLDAIKSKYPEIYENYGGFSDLGWREALKYKLLGKFSFKGNIISAWGETLSMRDAFAGLAEKSEKLTLDEIINFAHDMGTTIYFDAIYENMLRISANVFVSRSQANFNVKDTDEMIDRFCNGDYIPLAGIDRFDNFPEAGFVWTKYLLESYVAFYSEKFRLLHTGFNRNCAVGAIVKKSSGIDNFDDLIIDLLAKSDIALEKEKALDLLVQEEYISRRSYSNIEWLLTKAKAQRKRKGNT